MTSDFDHRIPAVDANSPHPDSPRPRKDPRSKNQAPEKIQTPRSNLEATFRLGSSSGRIDFEISVFDADSSHPNPLKGRENGPSARPVKIQDPKTKLSEKIQTPSVRSTLIPLTLPSPNGLPMGEGIPAKSGRTHDANESGARLNGNMSGP
jgi:hypothetical protein